jgi:hypothetical protein
VCTGATAAVHDRDRVGDLGHDADVVGDPHERHPVFDDERTDEREDPGLDGDVERGRRLVGDQHPRPTRERDREHHALAHAARQLVRVAVRDGVRILDADLVQEPHGAGGRLRSRRVTPEAQHLGDLAAGGLDRVERRHRVLRHVGDDPAARLAQLASAGGGEIEPLDLGPTLDAGSGRQQPRDRERRRGLPATRLADERERLAGRDRERDAAHGVHIAVADVQVLDGEALLDGDGGHRVASRVRGSISIRNRSIASVATTTRIAATTTVPISTGRSTL